MTSILIIDDDIKSIELLHDRITKNLANPAAINFAANVELASARLLQEQAAIVFINLGLPGAVELIGSLKTNPAKVVAIISNTAECLMAVEWLGVDYLLKPFNLLTVGYALHKNAPVTKQP